MILKRVSAAHQADVLQYDNEFLCAVLSVELWGRFVLDAPSSEHLVPGLGCRGRLGHQANCHMKETASYFLLKQ